ncbi:flagellar hook-associated protein FlgK [Sporohalobacter salinus]|uniref:flagellar hook-associated protein FlgK n=1 Tax=Sporohalobacter salinus TaxID=1494606 RepID=UPI001960984E|nr:flagellar hook-associated protein FlgK [Sporohalobacter salinus]MBM7623030.1 flagellar hook-associated protein FlgK [Sporohalobacter salinus]
MSSTFGGIEIGKRSLQAQKKSLDVAGHNISNTDTEGYHRQRAIHSANDPLTIYHSTEAGQIGTGVKIDEIERIKNEFIAGQIREESSAQGKWEVKNETLEQIELIFNEPSDKSLKTSMNQFWSSLEELSNNANSESIRATVRQRALSLTDTFNHLDTQLREYRSSLNNQIKTKVKDINSYAQRIADLNGQIRRVEATGQNANDLQDKRDLLVDKLSKITSISTNKTSNGAVTVSLEGQSLVWQDNANELETVEVSANNSNFNKTVEVRWASTKEEAKFDDGEMKGLLESRDEEIPKYVDQLNNMAEKLVTAFNNQHQKGYGLNDTKMTEMKSEPQADPSNPLNNETGQFDVIVNGSVVDSVTVNSGDDLTTIAGKINGVNVNTLDSNSDGTADTLQVQGSNPNDTIDLVDTSDTSAGEVNVIEELGIGGTGAGRDFFTGSNAGNIDLTDEIKSDSGLSKIAVAKRASDVANNDGVNDYAGDGTNALNLAQVGSKKLFNSGTSDFGGYYGSNISKLGVDGQRAKRMVDNQEALNKQLKKRRDSVSGVSLDEEMSKMIKYQHAYSAAAKFTSTMDQMLGVLVNNVKR